MAAINVFIAHAKALRTKQKSDAALLPTGLRNRNQIRLQRLLVMHKPLLI